MQLGGTENLFSHHLRYFIQLSPWSPKWVPESEELGQDGAEKREGKWGLCI